MINTLPKEIEYVTKELVDAGYEAFLVGGCVRDFLMGKIPKDYDVTTNATPEEIHRVFESKESTDGKDDGPHLIDTGIKHGTVTVIKNHIPVEVTTYRRESKYSDGRHPDSVEFSKSLEEDLARRDFTINAIAYGWRNNSPLAELVDTYNGKVDIERRIIRAVGNPGDRFEEDALRIMRSLRFASVLDFEIHEETSKALIRDCRKLGRISKERIQKELEGLLCGKGVERVLRDYADVIEVIIPEIEPMIGMDQCTPYHIYDLWEHTIRVVSGIPADPVLRLAALFHDIGKPLCFTKDEKGIGHFYGHPEESAKMTNDIMRRLKFDNKTREAVYNLVLWHDLQPVPTEKSVRKTISRVGAEGFDGWLALKRADNGAQAPGLGERLEVLSRVEEIGHGLIEAEGEMSLRTLRVKGKDLMDMGLEEGPRVGEILNLLLQEVLEERLPNQREKLLEWVRDFVS